MIRVKKAREPLPAPTSWVPATPPRRFLATNPHPSNYRIGPEPGPPLKSPLTCRMPAPTGTWRPGGNAAGIGRTRRSDGIEDTYCVGSHDLSPAREFAPFVAAGAGVRGPARAGEIEARRARPKVPFGVGRAGRRRRSRVGPRRAARSSRPYPAGASPQRAADSPASPWPLCPRARRATLRSATTKESRKRSPTSPVPGRQESDELV
jgi:hypothetical protein